MPAGLSTSAVCLDGMHQHCSNLLCGWGPAGAGWGCVVVPADLSMLVGLVCMPCYHVDYVSYVSNVVEVLSQVWNIAES